MNVTQCRKTRNLPLLLDIYFVKTALSVKTALVSRKCCEKRKTVKVVLQNIREIVSVMFVNSTYFE